MELSLFVKYQILLKETANKKKEIITLLQEKTGLLLEEKSLILFEKKIIVRLSSSQRAIFSIKKGKKILEEAGFFISFS